MRLSKLPSAAIVDPPPERGFVPPGPSDACPFLIMWCVSVAVSAKMANTGLQALQFTRRRDVRRSRMQTERTRKLLALRCFQLIRQTEPIAHKCRVPRDGFSIGAEIMRTRGWPFAIRGGWRSCAPDTFLITPLDFD